MLHRNADTARSHPLVALWLSCPAWAPLRRALSRLEISYSQITRYVYTIFAVPTRVHVSLMSKTVRLSWFCSWSSIWLITSSLSRSGPFASRTSTLTVRLNTRFVIVSTPPFIIEYEHCIRMVPNGQILTQQKLRQRSSLM